MFKKWLFYHPSPMTIEMNAREKVRNNWLMASVKLNFELVTPYKVNINGVEKELFAYLPKYGSEKGMVLELILAPEFKTDVEIVNWTKSNGYFYSFLNSNSYLIYNEEVFIEALKDWTIPVKQEIR